MKLDLKFRLLRYIAGLDQHQAAEKLKITVTDYSKIESGKLKSDNDVFDKLLLLIGSKED